MSLTVKSGWTSETKSGGLSGINTVYLDFVTFLHYTQQTCLCMLFRSPWGVLRAVFTLEVIKRNLVTFWSCWQKMLGVLLIAYNIRQA